MIGWAMFRKRNSINMNTALSSIITSLVKDSFEVLADNIADTLLLVEIDISRSCKDEETIIASLRINDQIADNIDKILLQYFGAIVAELKKEAFKIQVIKKSE